MNSCSTMLNCGLFSCFIVNEDQDTKGTKYIQKPLSVSSIFSNIKLNELYRWICWRMIWLIEKIIHDQSGLTHEEYSMKNKIQHELPTVQLQTRFPSWCTIILEVILAAMLSCAAVSWELRVASQLFKWPIPCGTTDTVQYATASNTVIQLHVDFIQSCHKPEYQ